MNSALIIFVKNLRRGKVKTRLAASFGEDAALEIYSTLLQHTRKITETLHVDKFLFYSDIVENDDWPADYSKCIQEGSDLGERMENAFQFLFRNEYEKMVIIGSDCLELHPGIINQAFMKLQDTDVVIGPAKDGGYYLLGLKDASPFLFINVDWGTNRVLNQTVSILENRKSTYALLETLNDIDEPQDWLNAKSKFV